MKHILGLLGGIIGVFLLAGVSFGQEKVPVVFSGNKQGTVFSVVKDGKTYVDVQKTARKLGADVTSFARSKQVKVTARGFYAILTAGLDEIVLNAQTVRLPAAVQADGADLLAPVEFFLLPQFGQAVGKEISFSGGTLQVERPFDLERTENVLNAKENQLVFVPRRAVKWTSATPNAHTVDITFPNATLKRDEHFRFKTDFIASATLRQSRSDGVLHVILGKKGKQWAVEEQGGKIYFRVAEKPLAPLAPVAEKPAAVQAPAAATPQTPSVLAEETEEKEDFAEMPTSTPATGTVLKSETPVISDASRPAPVIKPAPAPVLTPAHKKMRIVVDPGHGGKDPGAIRSRVREKDLNLAVSKELYKLLKKGNFEVKITRDDDTFIPLSGRSKIANTFKADLFVSVHTNSSKNRNANGFEVYFRSEKATDKEAAETAALENEAMQYEEVHYNFVDALLQSLAKNEYINESSKLAGHVRNAVYKQPGIGIAVNQNSSVRQANFYVLKGVQSPAILVEMGYISSNKDRGRLTQSAVQKRMAQGIYNGIYNYAKQECWIK